MKRAMLVLFAAAAVAGAITVIHPGPVASAASGSGSCRVREILASQGPEHVDDRVRDLARRFSRPPLNAWQHFDLVTDSEIEVTRGIGRVPLSHRTELTVHAGKARVRNDLGAAVLAVPLSLTDRRPQLFGGQTFDDGTQLLVVQCRFR